MRKNLLLSGRPGVGKTTLIKRISRALKEVGGFYTEEIREGGQRVGFKIRTFQGKEGMLAHINCRSPYRVGRYRVNLEDLEGIALPAIKEAISQFKFIIIDEIGKMELYGRRFSETVIQALDSEKTVLATIPHYRNEFLDRIRGRRDVEVIRITRANRDQLLPKILQMME